MKRFVLMIGILAGLLTFGVDTDSYCQEPSRAGGLYFPPLAGDSWDTMSPYSLDWCEGSIDSLYNFLEANQTKGFLLLKDGKIVLEKYFNGHDAQTLWYWASAGKSLTSFLIGLAQEEGFLNLDDTVSSYLGQGWTSCPPEKEKLISIRHQLTMTTGLDDGVADDYCTEASCLQYLADAGTRWAYHNAPYTLLDSVLEVATGESVNQYLNQTVKQKTGITGAYLTIDYNHVYFSTLRSMARYGLLMLNEGIWDTTVVMNDSLYFQEMIQPSQNYNPSYGYLWWINSGEGYLVPGSQFMFPGFLFPDAPADTYAALGKNGQFINIVPSENLVWVRMGEEPTSTMVPYMLNNKIWQYINELECDLSDESNEFTDKSVALYPNPVVEELHIHFSCKRGDLRLYDAFGQLLQSQQNIPGNYQLSVKSLDSGIYYLQIILGDKRIITKQIEVIK